MRSDLPLNTHLVLIYSRLCVGLIYVSEDRLVVNASDSSIELN